MSLERIEVTETEIIIHLPKPATSNIVGKCTKCSKDVDNAIEPYFTDYKRNVYCQACYQGE